MTALNLLNLTLEYPDGEGTMTALDSVNLSVNPGQFI